MQASFNHPRQGRFPLQALAASIAVAAALFLGKTQAGEPTNGQVPVSTQKAKPGITAEEVRAMMDENPKLKPLDLYKQHKDKYDDSLKAALIEAGKGLLADRILSPGLDERERAGLAKSLAALNATDVVKILNACLDARNGFEFDKYLRDGLPSLPQFLRDTLVVSFMPPSDPIKKDPPVDSEEIVNHYLGGSLNKYGSRLPEIWDILQSGYTKHGPRGECRRACIAAIVRLAFYNTKVGLGELSDAMRDTEGSQKNLLETLLPLGVELEYIEGDYSKKEEEKIVERMKEGFAKGRVYETTILRNNGASFHSLLVVGMTDGGGLIYIDSNRTDGEDLMMPAATFKYEEILSFNGKYRIFQASFPKHNINFDHLPDEHRKQVLSLVRSGKYEKGENVSSGGIVTELKNVDLKLPEDRNSYINDKLAPFIAKIGPGRFLFDGGKYLLLESKFEGNALESVELLQFDRKGNAEKGTFTPDEFAKLIRDCGSRNPAILISSAKPDKDYVAVSP